MDSFPQFIFITSFCVGSGIQGSPSTPTAVEIITFDGMNFSLAALEISQGSAPQKRQLGMFMPFLNV